MRFVPVVAAFLVLFATPAVVGVQLQQSPAQEAVPETDGVTVDERVELSNRPVLDNETVENGSGADYTEGEDYELYANGTIRFFTCQEQGLNATDPGCPTAGETVVVHYFYTDVRGSSGRFAEVIGWVMGLFSQFGLLIIVVGSIVAVLRRGT
jgi:hypothetical protein